MSSESLISPYWYRVERLHPRLRPHVTIQQQITRGQAWYVLFNQSTGRHHRVNAQAYELVGRLDGRFSVDEIWQRLIDQAVHFQTRPGPPRRPPSANIELPSDASVADVRIR